MSEAVDKDEEIQKIIYVSPDEIGIPEVRVTSVMDQELLDELIESIKQRGILEPIAVARVDGKLVLIDGLHRLYAAKKLGMKKVPVIIKDIPMDQVLIENLIRNRQRGHSDPAQEAEVLKTLIEEYGYTQAQAAEIMGISRTKARKLYAISSLPDEIKSYLRYRRIPSEGAYYLTFLQDPKDQIEIAEYAVKYGYTVDQIKAAVQQKLRPDINPEETGWTFSEAGEPQKVYPKCFLCGEEIKEYAEYVWLHPQCRELLEQAIQYLKEKEAAESQGFKSPGPEPGAQQQQQQPQKQTYWPY